MRLDSPHLFRWFSTQATIVTPNAVAAAVAARQLAEHQLASGLNSWERPAILSFDAWLISAWQEARYSDASVPALLSASQELLLWQQVIQAHCTELFDPAATAVMARRSARLMAEWDIPEDAEAWNDHQDSGHFQQWLRQFQQTCHDRRWMPLSAVQRLLPSWIEQKWIRPAEIVFAGFDERSPAFHRVIESLPRAKLLDPAPVKAKQKGAPVKCFEDPSSELEHAARWARAHFEQDSSVSIGMIVPGLAEKRAAVDRALRNVFYSTGTPDTSLFHFSQPPPLSAQPLVASALLLLELAKPRIDHADACSILRNPFVKGAVEERSLRAEADLRLRRNRELEVSLHEIERASRDCPLLLPVWAAVRRVVSQQRRVAGLPAWTEFMGDLLAAAGWPGEAELSAREQEIVQAWKNSLSSLASLGMVSAPIPFPAALVMLRRMLRSAQAPSGDWFSPIQVFSPQDAAGVEFDRLFVTGLSDDQWRPPIMSSPLIPWRLQRQSRVPGSSPERVWELWNSATAALFQAAPIVAGSYQETLSPLARPFVASSRNQDRWAGAVPLAAFSPADLEVMPDARAPAFDSNQQSRGGARVLKAQSACPFKAFAEIRLIAEGPDEASFGFDARDRGGFMHKGLELIWKRIESQERLRALPADELRGLIDECLVEAVHCDERDSQFQLQTTAAERERLADLIHQWLQLESRRLQPFTVEMLEQQRTVNIAGLQLLLRTDRVDRLPNDKFVLIDYKSGEQTLKKLQGPRPEEPQLLLYAAALGSEVEGIFFGQVKRGKLQAVGCSRDPQFEGKAVEVLGEGWPRSVEDWRKEVQTLAASFVAGDAQVNPKTKETCTYCQIKPFCRIAERDGTIQEWS